MRPSTSQYALRSLMAHLHATEDWPRLFDLLETTPFLSDQVEGLCGFQTSGDDLENHALPAAIAARDWQRFLHYAAVALNLRGLAEDLAAPEILRALARAGRVDLALDAAGRLPDSFGQAQALAAVASGCEDDPACQDVLRELEGRLDDLAREASGQAPFAETLATVARDAGPDLQGRWPGWIDRLASDQAAQVWRAIAEGWMQRRNPYEPGLWHALEAIAEPSQILAFAPAGLGAMNLERPVEILLLLEALLPDLEDRQRAGATLLGKLALREPERACAAWDEWSARSPLAWSMELIERGREVLGRLAPQHVEEIATSITDPVARTALRVVVLEARRTSETASAALNELRIVPDVPGKLHWSLRYLTARPTEPQDQDDIRRQVIAVGRYLHAMGFSADALDLARWLDLVALHLPDQISTQLDAVLWSPDLTPEKVCVLVDALTRFEILDLLVERAERCAAAVSPTEAEGFALRKDLLIRSTCRRCVLTESLETLQSVAERLLPEEEDELRVILAPRLAAIPEKGSKLAEKVYAEIGNRHLQLVTLLRSHPAIPSEVLAPANLYAALARVEILQDECHGLKALLETPADPRELIQRIVLPIRDPRIRTRALLRLARHTLAFEIACHDRPDRLAPLELVRWLITTETDDELASLTPEIAALGAGAGGKRAITEVQEAARQLAALETVDWAIRREALEDLLARMAAGLLPAPEAAAALATILRFPKQLRPETARQALRQRWIEILPLLTTTADRLPDKHLRKVRCELQEGLRDFSREPALPRIFELCLATATERENAADSISTAESCSELEALAYLLTKHSPRRVPEVVWRLPAPERARLALRLIRHGWLPGETARELLPCVAGDAREAEAEIWCGPEKGNETEWTERATLWIASEAPPPSDPSIEPLFSHVWSAPDIWRPALALAVQNSLRRGRPHGEAVLRTWLHAHLVPTPGRGRPQGLNDAAEAESALQLSLKLEQKRSVQ